MPRIELAFVTYLSAYAGLQALVGSRIYPQQLPEGVQLPAISYQRVSGPRIRSHSGPSELAHPRYQFNVWGDRYSDAKTVADQLRFALDGFRGTMGEVSVQAAFVEDDRDDFDTVTQQHRVIVDAILWHQEAIA